MKEDSMPRFFNTTGPCNEVDHYMLPPEDRLVGAQLERYISGQLYWVLHAPRQTGKTTFLQSWMHRLNREGQVLACYVSVEICQEFPEAEDSIPAICETIRSYSRAFLGEALVPEMPKTPVPMMLGTILGSWAALAAPRPLVVLFDEVDVLQDQAMVSFLRQLRGGFAMRAPGVFPTSITLVGMRDLRDYLIKSKEGVDVSPGSPFNVKEDSASLSNFTRDDVFTLIGQHEEETGQLFEEAAKELVWELAKGQPWLTNALCKKCVWTIRPQEEGLPVRPRELQEAKEMLIIERAVHLDSLLERLRDKRIRKIVEIIITGESDPELLQGDDFRFALDMGLVTIENGSPAIANPIYREIVTRVLSEPYQLSIPEITFRWEHEDGTLDMESLMGEFQKFWRRHGSVWEEKADYTEAFPHLLVMAFLQRLTNGGARIEREYAAGRGRMDLGVYYGGKWVVIEIKLIHPSDGRETTILEGLEQINRYREQIDPAAEAYLMVFDRTNRGREKPWEERLYRELRSTDQGDVVVIGG
jgi:GTPase SAR1 family protein